MAHMFVCSVRDDKPGGDIRGLEWARSRRMIKMLTPIPLGL